jgi:hypothetical protein
LSTTSVTTIVEQAMSDGFAGYGWASNFGEFRDASPIEIRGSLAAFLRTVSDSQDRAWAESIPPLQHEVGELIERDLDATGYSAILEYELPMEMRRPDVVFLSSGSVYVLEIKGKSRIEQAALDQAAGYARDLSAYHAECHGRPVHPVLVLTRARGRITDESGVHVVGLDAVDNLIDELDEHDFEAPILPNRFLAAEAYSPLPTILEAARELFESGTLRRVHRAAADTQPALDEITRIIHEAARTGTRRLILLTGIPGAGKTLVGLQVAHARFLDDLSVPRRDGRPSAPAVYLSGNGPLVQVLQYEFQGSGGAGKAFVRDVKSYVRRYSARSDLVPPEHVLIYDEAQRAWDAAQMADKHPASANGRSEPEHFIEFAERVPQWCVVLGLIGGGQEIHIGEEAGLGQWRSAVGEIASDRWVVHGPAGVADQFAGFTDFVVSPSLHLDREIRFHLARDIDRFVERVLGEDTSGTPAALAQQLEASRYHLRITRDLDAAKRYLRSRYQEDPEARFGMVASSRDKDLRRFGIDNARGPFTGFRAGPWYVEGDGDPRQRSCRALLECVTEFSCQGLELDAVLLGWGTDFFREIGQWTNRLAKRYQNPARIRDAYQLRVNAYRVLLTRARDATVIFVPPMPLLDETYSYLLACGFLELRS